MTCVVRILVGCAVSKVNKRLAVDGGSCCYDRGTGERRMDNPGDLICGLYVIAHDIGDLDDEDLQLLVASLEYACARGFLARRQAS